MEKKLNEQSLIYNFLTFPFKYLDVLWSYDNVTKHYFIFKFSLCVRSVTFNLIPLYSTIRKSRDRTKKYHEKLKKDSQRMEKLKEKKKLQSKAYKEMLMKRR